MNTRVETSLFCYLFPPRVKSMTVSTSTLILCVITVFANSVTRKRAHTVVRSLIFTLIEVDVHINDQRSSWTGSNRENSKAKR